MISANFDVTPEMPDKRFEQKLRLWKELRSAISHEDDLVHQRSTWLLTFEGFLMGGFFVAQTSMLGRHAIPHRRLGELFLLSLLLAGLWICVVTARTISAAHEQVGILREFWVSRFTEERWPGSELRRWRWSKFRSKGPAPAASEFPPLHGVFTFGFLGGMAKIPTILFLVNLVAAVSCIPLAIWG